MRINRRRISPCDVQNINSPSGINCFGIRIVLVRNVIGCIPPYPNERSRKISALSGEKSYRSCGGIITAENIYLLGMNRNGNNKDEWK